MKKRLRYIPNILSLSRVPLSIAFFFVAKHYKIAFIVLFCVAGVFDALDGFLARKFHWESKWGAKIDSIGDIAFLFCAITCVILVVEELNFAAHTLVSLGAMSAWRIGNIIFTKIKFGQWGYIHTFFTQKSTIPIFCIAPYVIYTSQIPHVLLTVLICFTALAAVEETFILIHMKDYDMNMRSIYHMMKHKKRMEEVRETVTV